MSDFKAKMQKNLFRLRELTALPRPLARFKGPTSGGEEKEGRKVRKRREGGNGKEGKKMKGMGCPVFLWADLATLSRNGDKTK